MCTHHKNTSLALETGTWFILAASDGLHPSSDGLQPKGAPKPKTSRPTLNLSLCLFLAALGNGPSL